MRYDFHEKGEGTEIVLTHSALPEEGADHIAKGWEDNYWGPLAKYLAE